MRGVSRSGSRRVLFLLSLPLLGAALVLVYLTTRPSESPTPAPTPRPEAAAVSLADAGRRFVSIGTNDGRQFTEDEYRDLATNYDVVVFTKFHAGWEIDLHHEATRRLKELNPELRVYGYMSTKYWFNGNRWEEEIDPGWFLRDEAGAVIPVTREAYDLESKDLGTYIDVSDADYRTWLLDIARSWLDEAPYDGIRFDAADHIGDFGNRDIKKWADLLTPEKVQEYNDGIDELFETFGEELHPARVLFNGISPSPLRGPERNLFMLGFTDGAMNENFCVDSQGEDHDLVADIEIMERFPDKSLQMRARYDPSTLQGAELERLERLCVGAFLMGWQPNATFLNMGFGYGVEQLSHQPADLDVDLGGPIGAHTSEGDLLTREFAHGWVYVNVGTTPVELAAPEKVVRVEGGVERENVEGPYQLQAKDAVFLLRPD